MPDTDLKFGSLVHNEALYSSNFKKHFGITEVPLESETWRQRERALAHDMVCVLLCNLQVDKLVEHHEQYNSLQAFLKRNNRKKKLRNSSREDEDDEEGKSSTESELDSDEDIGEGKRYRLLKRLSVPSQIQNLYMKKWKLEPKRKIYDIIDITEKKFVEIKFSMSAYERIRDFSNHPETDEFTSLILVHPGTAYIDYINKIDKMPGTKRVKNWILQRKSILNSFELCDCAYDEEEYYKEFIYSNPSMNTLFLEFRKFYCKKSVSENLLDLNIAKLILQPIESSLLAENASEQHSNVEKPDISWDGNLLPPCWKNYIDVENNDRDSIDKFLNTFEDYKVTSILGDSKLYKCYEQIIQSYKKLKTPYVNYAFLKCNNSKEIKSVLGNSWMCTFEAQVINNPIEKRKYNKWFDHLVDKLAREHPFQQEYTFIMASETEEYTEMYKNSKVIVEKFNKILSRTFVGIMISETENLYSRLCGAYLTSKEECLTNKEASRIAVIPIKSTYYRMNSEKKYETKHRVSGIFVRGPTDALRLSDKTNFVSIEIVNEDFKASYLKESCIVEFDNGQRLVIRQGTYKKLSAAHITYNKNLLVNPFNFLIDVFNVRTRQKSKLQIETICEEFFSTYEKLRYFLYRVIENTLMGLIGNSRDEIYFSMFRELLQTLIYRRRRQSSSLRPKIKEFCDSISEYLIDNPVSMYCHNRFLNNLNFL